MFPRSQSRYILISGTIIAFNWNGETQELVEKQIGIGFEMVGQTAKSVICPQGIDMPMMRWRILSQKCFYSFGNHHATESNQDIRLQIFEFFVCKWRNNRVNIIQKSRMVQV